MTTDATIPTPQGLLERILRFAIAHRWLMLALTVALIAVGSWSFSRLPIDVTPDITNVQVQVNTQVDGYSPLESEQRVTFPIETALAGLPGLDYTRSISRYGLSQVTVVFKDGTDLYFARQQVAERLQQVKPQLPAGLEPEMGPIATGMGDAKPEWLHDWDKWTRMTAVARGNLFHINPDIMQRHTPRILDGTTKLCAHLDVARSRRPAK